MYISPAFSSHGDIAKSCVAIIMIQSQSEQLFRFTKLRSNHKSIVNVWEVLIVLCVHDAMIMASNVIKIILSFL